MGNLDAKGGAVGGSTCHQPTKTTLSILFRLSFALGPGSREEEMSEPFQEGGKLTLWKGELTQKQATALTSVWGGVGWVHPLRKVMALKSIGKEGGGYGLKGIRKKKS